MGTETLLSFLEHIRQLICGKNCTMGQVPNGSHSVQTTVPNGTKIHHKCDIYFGLNRRVENWKGNSVCLGFFFWRGVGGEWWYPFTVPSDWIARFHDSGVCNSERCFWVTLPVLLSERHLHTCSVAWLCGFLAQHHCKRQPMCCVTLEEFVEKLSQLGYSSQKSWSWFYILLWQSLLPPVLLCIWSVFFSLCLIISLLQLHIGIVIKLCSFRHRPLQYNFRSATVHVFLSWMPLQSVICLTVFCVIYFLFSMRVWNPNVFLLS